MNNRHQPVHSGKHPSRDRQPARKRPPHRQARRRKRRSGVLPALIVLIFCAVAFIPVAKTVFGRGDTTVPANAPAAQQAAETAPSRTDDAPTITLPPQATEAPTPEPTAEPTQAPTPEPTPEPTEAPTPEPTPFAYLPVTHRAETEKKWIAVTVDDCYQLDNLKAIANVAEKGGAKLTFFPIGEALAREGMSDFLRRCAFDLGFELENHTYNHERIFRLPDDEMAEQIWKQSAALNKTLGVNYQEHFLRLMGGDGDTDPRIHSYLAKLGFLGIANWSVSGTDSDMKHIKSSLAPGQVYLFHATDPDTKKLKEFIPWALSQGYKLVTLNELFNLPANEVSELTDQVMPQPDANVDDHHTLKKEEYTWVVARLQDALREMGYLELDGPSTGYYGEQTVKAVTAFQKDHGLPPTGEADEETQARILEGR